jgi:recombinational DNA repair protein (RecF pathway)
MHQKYTTEGFLVSQRASGEADRLFLFYTKEFGMVLASAKSVRSAKSKLRPHILPCARLSLTLLKSKNRWMLLEAVVLEKLPTKSERYKTFLKLLLILKTLAFGEERNESLFVSLEGVFKYLVEAETESMLSAAECLSMVKILHALGYGEPENENNYQNADFDEQTLSLVAKERTDLVLRINKALKETGLQ